MNSASVSKVVGMSQRQLQYWDEKGFVVPRRSGHQRIYTQELIGVLESANQLRRRGIPLQKALTIAKTKTPSYVKKLLDAI